MPLTAEGCAARRQKLLEAVDATLIIVTNPRHIQYLSGFYVNPLQLNAGGRNFLILDKYRQKTILLTSNWQAHEAQAAFVDEIHEWLYYDARNYPAVLPFATAIKELNLRLPVGGKRIGAEKGWLPWEAGVDDLVDITPILYAMRRQKYPDELAMIQRAIDITAAGHRAAREAVQVGVTELEVYNAIQSAINLAAGVAVPLMGDFASGERAFNGGGVATSRRLGAGEVMILDLFPVIDGYKGDYTATISTDGQMNDWQAELEKALHDALAAAEALLKPEAVAGDIFEAVYLALKEHNPVFADGFTHHAGHGIGLGHPEPPYLVSESTERLMVGDVITLEPGSYDAEMGFGGRIEHNYLITETGFTRLTNHDTRFVT